MPEKEGKLHDIKETASDAVAIMRELATPGVQESFGVIREIAVIAKDIMETMKSPEWQQNMENIRAISENINSVSARMDRTSAGLKETGIIDDAKELISTVRAKMGTFSGDGQQSSSSAAGGGGRAGISGQDLKELSTSFKEMLEAIKALASEMRVTVAESKKSGIMHNIEETISEASETYRTLQREVEEAEKKKPN
ncbi:MAG TPA: hypothetical protein VJ695_09690 [Nitrososphaera sp.]|nr:hypothetical protein [Nitrososphaera sp.]